MKKTILLVLMSLACLANVQAQECCVDDINLYVKVFGGANALQDTTRDGNRASYQSGYIFAGSVGYCWNYGLRLEAEYAFRNNDIRKIHFFIEDTATHGYTETSSCMANLVWNIPLSKWGCDFWGVQPFVGAGIGYDFREMHASNSRIDFHQTWNQFAWQLMLGGAYPIFCNTDMTVEYKFHQGSAHFYDHAVGIGIIYNFGL